MIVSLVLVVNVMDQLMIAVVVIIVYIVIALCMLVVKHNEKDFSVLN
jgi:hypothetical protein